MLRDKGQNKGKHMSKKLQAKVDKIKGLISQYNWTADVEADIDSKVESHSAKSIREMREELDYQRAKIEEKIGKVWVTLMPEQQIQVLNHIEFDDRWILDGF